jgi:hypothetical protein
MYDLKEHIIRTLKDLKVQKQIIINEIIKKRNENLKKMIDSKKTMMIGNNKPKLKEGNNERRNEIEMKQYELINKENKEKENNSLNNQLNSEKDPIEENEIILENIDLNEKGKSTMKLMQPKKEPNEKKIDDIPNDSYNEENRLLVSKVQEKKLAKTKTFLPQDYQTKQIDVLYL